MKISSTKDATSKGVKMVMYGASGSGKTTLIETLPNPIIISSEAGLLSLADADIPVIEVTTEDDLKQARDYCAKSDYESVALDSMSDIAESILAEYKDQFSDGRQAYGKLNDFIGKELRKFRAMEKNVYIITKEGKSEVNGVAIVAPEMPGKTLTTNVPYIFDLVLRLEANKKGERIIHTAASFTQVAKDRSGKLDNKEVPDLGAIIQKVTGEASNG
jgi:phage nucleotide-binding protein